MSTLHNATRKLVDDPEFLIVVEKKLHEIMEDGKITSRDIPDIMLLVINCTDNLGTFNLSYEELTDVLEETINYLLEHFKVIPEDDKDDFRLMTKTVVKLVMLRPRVKTCITSCWYKIKCC